MAVAFTARLSDYLIEARRRRITFERAWIAALGCLGPLDGFPACRDNALCEHPDHTAERRLWESAYYGRGRKSTQLSLLTERGAYVDHEYVAPEPPRGRACGWNKYRDGCPEPAREGGWLCDAHRALVRVPAVSPLCIHPGCHETEEPNYALIVDGVVDDFCKRHREETDALTREAVAA